MATKTDQIQITLKHNRVLRIENNKETENWGKAKIKVGDKISKELYALLAMNPHRFNLIKEN